MQNIKEFFELEHMPFTNTPDSKFFFRSPQHEEALLRLNYAVHGKKGLAVIKGNIGMGKTLLSRLFLASLDENEYEAALIVIVHSEINSEWFLKRLSQQLGIDNLSNVKTEMVAAIYKRLSYLNDQGKKVVIIIDEAQMIKDKQVMEEIRGVLNFEDEHGKMITFVLFGLPTIDEVLSVDESLKQRIAVKFSLTPFDFDTMKRYIIHRLKVAGSKYNYFIDDAMSMIFDFSKGIPRLINTICDNAMFEAYLLKKKQIDKVIIAQVIENLGLK
ncbi:MAG: AAA family ATPase [Calditerrivibrio sp.]|nr:AAA family ATPase [Calditerrivibrio sp.]